MLTGLTIAAIAFHVSESGYFNEPCFVSCGNQKPWIIEYITGSYEQKNKEKAIFLRSYTHEDSIRQWSEVKSGSDIRIKKLRHLFQKQVEASLRIVKKTLNVVSIILYKSKICNNFVPPQGQVHVYDKWPKLFLLLYFPFVDYRKLRS